MAERSEQAAVEKFPLRPERWVEVGPRLRAARKEQGTSLREFARQLGCSPSHISQIERGIVDPSLGMLYAIVESLGLSLDELFDADHEPSPGSVSDNSSGEQATADETRFIQRADRRKSIEIESGVRWELLTPQPEPSVDFREIIYEPGGGSSPGDRFMRHTGREYGILLDGELQIQIGFEQFTLHEGDSIAFESALPHRIRNEGDRSARAIWFTCTDRK